MRQSQLFTKTSKSINQEETSINAQLLLRAGYISKLMAGVYTLLPLGNLVVNRIAGIIREEMNLVGGQEVSMPALQPKANWQKTGRWDTMHDILYKLQDEAGHEYTLGPTHEEIVVPLVKQYVQSYKDLPCAVYQFQHKFRKELRPKSGILRGREFLMKDMYSFHSSVSDLDKYYDAVTQAYKNIFKRMGLADTTYLTFASGGAFAKYSHEFQTVTEAGEDIIFICTQCHLAINKEIKSETPTCPSCDNDQFDTKKSIEVGNIFKLMTKFSEPFKLEFTAETGQKQPVVMGCYGIGLTRLLGTIVEIYHDDKGIIWPVSVAPYQAHLINLNKDSTQANTIYAALQKAQISVLYDDRITSVGNKLADADLLGLPDRLIIGQKTSGKLEWKQRQAEATQLVTPEQYINNYHEFQKSL
ncbi:MAG: aminoacyl--tRNA ligase-related protein [Patescibacteria group bacterium]|jgi:prolyl-tRNA synthetase